VRALHRVRTAQSTQLGHHGNDRCLATRLAVRIAPGTRRAWRGTVPFRIALTHGSLAAIAVVACTAALPAQHRQPLVGRVLDASGATVAGAQVTLVWSPPGGLDGGDPDVVECTTDDRGRFVARLLRQECYSAWATDGQSRASGVAEGVAAGGELQLRLDGPAARPRVRLVGVDAWAAAGPLHVEVAMLAANIVGFALDANTTSRLMPCGSGLAIVRDATNGVLCVQRIGWTDQSGPLHVNLPLTLTMQVLALDPTGEPVAGATVRHAAASEPSLLMLSGAMFYRPDYRAWRTAGITGKDGTTTIVAPRSDGYPGLLTVRAPGMAECLIQMPNPVGSITIGLERAARLRVCGGGTPLRDAEILLTSGYLWGQRVARLQLDDDGTCELSVPLHPIETMLHVRRKPCDPWNLMRISFASGEVTQVDLSFLRSVSLQFLDESGGPARGLNGVLVAIGTDHSMHQRVTVSTDQAGRLERNLGGDAWLLVLSDGFCWQRVDVPRAAPGPRRIDSTVKCERLPMARFRMLDAAGMPVAGARMSWGPGNGAIGCGPGPAGDHYSTILHLFQSRSVPALKSDERGLLDIPLLARWQGMRCSIWSPSGGRADVVLAAGETTDVTLTEPGGPAAAR
jgi:hypothetical protein